MSELSDFEKAWQELKDAIWAGPPLTWLRWLLAEHPVWYMALAIALAILVGALFTVGLLTSPHP